MNLIQIGTNTGDDDFFKIVNNIEKSKIEKLILVEPLSFHNENIKNVYKDFNFDLENLVININESTKIETFFVSRLDYLSSLKKSHIEKHETNEIPIEMKIESVTLNNLFDKYGLSNIDVLFIDTEGMDDEIIMSIDFKKYKINKIYYEHAHINNDVLVKFLERHNYYVENAGFSDGLTSLAILNETENKKITLVTGLWDLNRDSLETGWARSFEGHYLKKFEELLSINENLIIFGDSELEKFVFERRNKKNTKFINRNLDWFKNNEYYDLIQNIRNDEDWYGQVGWLSQSTQAKLEMYNPVVMSKMFLLHDAKIFDVFNSEYMFWIDAGITNTVHKGYFTHDNVLEKMIDKIKKFTFICFPYETTTEIHGFKYPDINNYAKKDVKKVARGGFFGGPKEDISNLNSIYYNLLLKTLRDGYMGTEESIFSIIVNSSDNSVQYFDIEENGLISKFFEDCKNDIITPLTSLIENNELFSDIDKTALYVITFNSPNQLKTLIESIIQYDNNFLDKPKKFLLNNSTDRSTDEEYTNIANQYDFEIIWKNENLGITGGRQFIAEHFDETGLDYYLFFEDDMFFYNGPEKTCRNGFNRKTDNLYTKVLEISQKENFDFLKLNFSEFYGDNSIQWSWYNVPQHFRESHWPNNTKLPQMGLDPNAPRTEFKNIKSHKGVPYATGEIYLCNWPVLFSKKGNYKCYLETKYASPFEQTLMSHNYQETIKGNVKPGILLMTPTEHNRFEHYDGSLRKEC